MIIVIPENSAGNRWSELGGANLIQADLEEADLTGADLVKADRADANLTRANLSRASLDSADLTEADLIDATVALLDARWVRVSGFGLKRSFLSACPAPWEISSLAGTKLQDKTIALLGCF